jgi:segregation and condensation protein B
MDAFEIKPILEGLIFVSDSPVRLDALSELLPELDRDVILEGIRQIQAEYEGDSKGLELMEIAVGYQFRTKPKWAEWIAKLRKSKPVKLSQSALETLAIIAYRQPVIRPEIDDIRGVDSGWVLRGLLEKGLIKIAGRRDLPGRPIIYSTTKSFLELFSLNTLSDLPSLREIQPPPPTGETTGETPQEEIPKSESDASPVEETPSINDILEHTGEQTAEPAAIEEEGPGANEEIEGLASPSSPADPASNESGE